MTFSSLTGSRPPSGEMPPPPGDDLKTCATRRLPPKPGALLRFLPSITISWRKSIIEVRTSAQVNFEVRTSISCFSLEIVGKVFPDQTQ
ncbi:hypothetical protein [Rhizobium sp. TRM95796]|uniref:hypothetical protein n=1 Tax=Rhizobium sp. TRM95796 TaxID=2979862 RepID=UPI0021E7AB3C|nr:hypothetical protein [Rhizobium sp. TRM95796]MCV3767737.1 hypothetical protein [Rhizobium sp. TRM95796]